jgi:hypothetical protein
VRISVPATTQPKLLERSRSRLLAATWCVVAHVGAFYPMEGATNVIKIASLTMNVV